MKNDISRKDLERALKQEVKVPEDVNKRIRDTYKELGIHTKVSMRYSKNHRILVAAAAVAVLAVGMSAVTFAAAKFLSVDLVEKGDEVSYDVQVDKSMVAHEIEVEPSYMPEGYVLADVNTPHGGKWSNEDTDGSISILPYNAADLARLTQQGGADFQTFAKDSHMKEMDISGMKTDVFVNDRFYTDSEKTVKSIYLFNEEHGYGVHVWSESELPAEELIKVAEGLKVTVLDTVVPYEHEAEAEKAKGGEVDWKKKELAKYDQGVPESSLYGLGEEVKNPAYDEDDQELLVWLEDIRYKVEDVEVKDSLSLEEYPAENYVDYENSMAEWVNPDGTLKPRDRYTYPLEEMYSTTPQGTLETVGSKYVVVKMWAKNYSDTQSDWNKKEGIQLAPYLALLTPQKDGSCAYPEVYTDSANEGYSIQGGASNGSSFPVYFDKVYFKEGIKRLKGCTFRPMAPGEELEYTMVYVVDEDKLDNMYLWFYSGNGSENPDSTWNIEPYVKISE